MSLVDCLYIVVFVVVEYYMFVGVERERNDNSFIFFKFHFYKLLQFNYSSEKLLTVKTDEFSLCDSFETKLDLQQPIINVRESKDHFKIPNYGRTNYPFFLS